MPNMMQRAAAFLGEKMQDAAGRSVNIVVGATTLNGLTCWHAEKDYEVVDSEGFPTKVHSYDWTIVASDVASVTLRPGATLTDSTTSEVYEAMGIGKRPAAERLDSSGVLLLLHTKRVS